MRKRFFTMALVATLVLSSSVMTFAADTKTGLLGYYTFDDTLANSQGGTASTVGSKTTTAATAATATYAAGHSGKALSMAGANSDGIKLDVKPSSNNYTVSCWVNITAATTYTPVVFVDSNTYSGTTVSTESWVSLAPLGWKASIDLGPMVWSKTGGSYMDLTADDTDNPGVTGKLTTGAWACITFVSDNGTGTIYVNGEKVASSTKYAQVVTDATALYLGVNAWDTPFNGLMDDVYVFDRALTAEDVAALVGPITTSTETTTVAETTTSEPRTLKVNQTTTSSKDSGDEDTNSPVVWIVVGVVAVVVVAGVVVVVTKNKKKK